MYGVIGRLAQTTTKLKQEVLVPSAPSSTYTLRPLFSNTTEEPQPTKVEHLRCRGRRKQVVGIDSTCVPLAESIRGVLYAARVCRVTFTGERFVVDRFGPLLVYMTAETVSDLFSELSRPQRRFEVPTPTSRYSAKIIMTMLERWLLSKTVDESSDSLVLVDGPLSPTEFELRTASLGRILRRASERRNRVIGVSKSSKLFKISYGKMIALSRSLKPAVVEVSTGKRLLRGVLGRVFLGYLSHDGVPLRIDVSMHDDRPLESVEILVSSDQMAYGYPETLRQAHILCKLSASEKIGLRASLRSFDAVLIPSERARDIIFGPFNSTAEG